MKKKVIMLLMATTLVMSGCGNSSSTSGTGNESDKSAQVAETETEKEPLDLTGTWTSEDNDGSWMEAVVSDGVITINWVSDNGDTKSIYWVGTYDAPTEYVEEYSWTSERDKEKTDSALMASTDDTKDFSYTNDEITYEASALGTTTTIHLAKSN